MGSWWRNRVDSRFVVGNGLFRTQLWFCFAVAGDVRDEQWGIGNADWVLGKFMPWEMEDGRKEGELVRVLL
jgi:hypothetical protein